MILITDAPAPDLLYVLVLPFSALLLCCSLGLGIYKVWGRMKGTE